MQISRTAQSVGYCAALAGIAFFIVKFGRPVLAALPQNFLSFALVIGCIQLFEAFVELTNKKSLQALASAAFLVEAAWSIILAWYLFRGNVVAPVWYSASFIAYFIVVLVVAAVAIKRQPQQPVSKIWAFAGGAFGLYYALTAFYLNNSA